MMVSTTYIRPREFIVLSPNIDVFCAKIQLPVIQQTFTFAGDHIVSELWWEEALLCLTNHDSRTLSDRRLKAPMLSKLRGGGLWSWGEWRWNGGITHNKHPEDSKPTRQPETSILHQVWAEEQESAHDSGAMAEEPYLRTRRRQHNIKPQQSISSSSIAPLLWISVQKPKGLSDENIDKLSHQHEPAVLSIILFQRLSSVRIPQYNGCTTAVSNRTRNGSITPTNFASIQTTLDRNNFLPFSHEVMTGLELMTWGSFLWLCVSSSNFNTSYSKGHCIFSKGLYDRQNYNDA